MRRKGLGKGLGKGYKNLLSVYDSHIHSLSAKGISLHARGYDLTPQYDSRKSFYSKARVELDGKDLILYSYNTKVAQIIDGVPTVFGSYSVTTIRHIKEFLKQNGFKAESTKQILKDYSPSSQKPKQTDYSEAVVPKLDAVIPQVAIKSKVNEKNLVNYITEFEGGNPRTKEVLELFSYLINTGQVWNLQGSYGRQATRFIESGMIDKTGKINWDNVADPDRNYY